MVLTLASTTRKRDGLEPFRKGPDPNRAEGRKAAGSPLRQSPTDHHQVACNLEVQLPEETCRVGCWLNKLGAQPLPTETHQALFCLFWGARVRSKLGRKEATNRARNSIDPASVEAFAKNAKPSGRKLIFYLCNELCRPTVKAPTNGTSARAAGVDTRTVFVQVGWLGDAVGLFIWKRTIFGCMECHGNGMLRNDGHTSPSWPVNGTDEEDVGLNLCN